MSTLTLLPDGLAADVADLADLATVVYRMADGRRAAASADHDAAQARLEQAEWEEAARGMDAARARLGQLCGNGYVMTNLKPVVDIIRQRGNAARGLPDWWTYPTHCQHGHPWGAGKVIVSCV